MKQLIVLLVVFMAVTTGLFTQEPESNDQNEDQNKILITSISVSGLKKTRPYIVENPLKTFIGKDAESINENEVYAVIQSTGVVELLSYEVIGSTLTVTVRDKWSIFPIPIVTFNSSGWGAGAVFLDTNAFGVNDTMMIVGMYTPGDIMASLMYIGTPDGTGEFGWTFTGMFSMRGNESFDQKGKKGELLQRYNSMVINPEVGLSYSISPLIAASLGLSYKYVGLRDSDNPVNKPENGVHGIGLSPHITMRLPAIWDGYFLDEKKLSMQYGYTIVVDSTDIHSGSFSGAFNYSFIPGFRAIVNTGLVFATPSATPFFTSSPVSAAVNILPSNYYAFDFAGLSLGLEKYLFKFKFGTLAISAAYQAVYSNGAFLANQFDHGPVGMLLLYLNRVAIPAVGIGGAYNVDKNVWQYAVNVGVQF
jgi:outer membrane protein assembly factor BamA